MHINHHILYQYWVLWFSSVILIMCTHVLVGTSIPMFSGIGGVINKKWKKMCHLCIFVPNLIKSRHFIPWLFPGTNEPVLFWPLQPVVDGDGYYTVLTHDIIFGTAVFGLFISSKYTYASNFIDTLSQTHTHAHTHAQMQPELIVPRCDVTCPTRVTWNVLFWGYRIVKSVILIII